MSITRENGAATHEVANQPPPLQDYNLVAEDRPLMEAVSREGGDWARDRVLALGELAGRPETLELGRLANENPPRLRTHDRYGNRIDEVEFHPAWHELMRISLGSGIASLPWREPQPGAHAARAALLIVASQVEAGHQCPVTMTFAAVPALRTTPALAARLEPKLTSLEYDPALVPLPEKTSALSGMAMTEKQGGSDVRANTTHAEPTGVDGERRDPAPGLTDDVGQGSVQLDLRTGVGAVAELVLEALEMDAVARAVGQDPRHQEAGHPGLRLGQHQEHVAHRGRAEPLVPGQLVWSGTRAWTARSAPRPGCERPSLTRPTTRPIARRSASRWPSSR